MPNFILEEDLKDDAKAYFGTTWSWKKAFYINTDGTLLDCSGAKLGARGDARTVDHREVSDIFDDIDGNDAMLAYMNEGNIRWKPETPGFELIIEPTRLQYETLSKILYEIKDVFYADFSDSKGNVIKSKVYARPSQQIIFDIEDYFDGKELNEVYPNKGESKKDFISRFMSATKKEYPDLKQRFAVANSYWDRRKLKEDAEDIYYHGSPTCDIKDFIVNNDDRPQSFFTKSKQYALEYAKDWETGEPKCLYTVKLDMKNPLDVKSKLGEWLKKKLNCQSNVNATDIIYSYLQKHDGQIKIKSSNGDIKILTFDGIKSYEDLSAKHLQIFGEEGNVCYVPLKSSQIKIIKKEILKEKLTEDTKIKENPFNLDFPEI